MKDSTCESQYKPKMEHLLNINYYMATSFNHVIPYWQNICESETETSFVDTKNY